MTMSLKPLSTSVNAALLRCMILHWRQADITPSQTVKFLRLFLGEKAWMDPTGKYPYANFYEIARTLKFKNTVTFLACLAKCKGFGFIWETKEHSYQNIAAFYSPLWHDIRDGTYYEVSYGDLKFENSAQAQTQKSLRNSVPACNNIYINNNYNTTSKGENSPTGNIPENGSSNKMPNNCNEEAIKEFIKKLYLDSTACQTIIKPINEYTEQKIPSLKCCSDDAINANPSTKRFLEHYLFKHLCINIKKFAVKTHDGRIYWISNLIKYDFMHKMMDRAVSDFIKQHGGSERAMQQQNRPLSPYEYQDPLTHQRLYDFTNQDGKQCQARIPANAAPRPSDTVYWNKFSKTWMEWRN